MTMEWDNKIKMVKLGNAMNNDGASRTEFQNYCLEQMPSFDEQAWDMFCNIIEILPDEMEKEKPFWEKVWFYIKKINCQKFGLRSGMRIALIQTICQDILKFEK